jgi:hypothetical protein
MCHAAGDHSPERSISVTLHDRPVSFTLAKFSVDVRFDDFCVLGEEISEAVRKILEGKCPNPNE